MDPNPIPNKLPPLKPMLVHNYAPHFIPTDENGFFTVPVRVQSKLNGIRAVWCNGELRSRDGKRFSRKVLPHLYAALDKEFVYVPLDGELYVDGWPLQRINSACAVKRKLPTADSPSVMYHIFDSPLPILSFEMRQALIHEATLNSSLFNVCVGRVTTIAEVREAYRRALACGHEGLIIRIGDNPYEFGKRSYTTLKLKPWQQDVFPVNGLVEGKGKG